MAKLKRLLNKSEEATDKRLQEVCEPYGVRVFVKSRLADVFPIKGSGIAAREYRFALQAHFDFVVADESTLPLFAVEFDGPQHEGDNQIILDAMKNALCRQFGLPLLRVDNRFLDARYMDMDLLTWLVQVVLVRRADRALVEAGDLSPQDAAASDPIFCAPFVISYEARERLFAMSADGTCARYPPFVIGVDEQENAYALAGIRLANGMWVQVFASMRYQGFFLLAEDLLEEILYIKLADAVEAVIAGRRESMTADEFAHRVGEFLQKYRSHHAFLINPRNGEIGNIG